ncbi:MAG: hypothetical protein HKN79_08415, partial [Flavobacteriales bacterium]|nr:hypothetical protein [Flavobacteriales bacterium]
MSVAREMWTSISEVGLHPDMDERLVRKIKLTNQICLVACFMTIGQIFALPEVFPFVLLCIGCVLSYTLTWVMNYYKKYDMSRLYFCLVSCLGITYSASVLAIESNVAFKFILLEALVLPLIVFDARDKWKSLTGVGIYVVALAFMDILNERIPIIDGVDPALFADPMIITMNSILVVVNLYLGYRYLQKLNYQAEEKLADSLAISNAQKDIIQAKNKDIQDGINYAQRIQQAILP